jgi:hypothetical protein
VLRIYRLVILAFRRYYFLPRMLITRFFQPFNHSVKSELTGFIESPVYYV